MPPPRWMTSRPGSTSGPTSSTPTSPPTTPPGPRTTPPRRSTMPPGRSTTPGWPCWTPSTPAPTPTNSPSRRRVPSPPRPFATSSAACLPGRAVASPRGGRQHTDRLAGPNTAREDSEDEQRDTFGHPAEHRPGRGAGPVGSLVVVPFPRGPVDPVRHLRALLPGGQPGRGGRPGRRGLPVRRVHPAGGGHARPELALAVHRGRHPGGGRRDPHLRLARHHPVRGVDPGRLVSRRLRHHALGRRAGRSQGALLVDPAAARGRRADPRGVGGAFLAAVAAHLGAPGGVGAIVHGGNGIFPPF